MPVISPSDLLQSLNWRYATKRFDPHRKIPADLWHTLESALVLTPSSFGLQPWRFLVITDPAVKAQLRKVSWDQSQVEDCSHLVVFTARKEVREEHIDHFVDRIAEVRGVSHSSLAGYSKMMKDSLLQGPKAAQVEAWAGNQIYIALGQFMTSAAVLGIDTCPMEGIVAPEYDRILGLSGSGFRSWVACPTGYRSPEDAYATTSKVRFPAAEVIQRME